MKRGCKGRGKTSNVDFAHGLKRAATLSGHSRRHATCHRPQLASASPHSASSAPQKTIILLAVPPRGARRHGGRGSGPERRREWRRANKGQRRDAGTGAYNDAGKEAAGGGREGGGMLRRMGLLWGVGNRWRPHMPLTSRRQLTLPFLFLSRSTNRDAPFPRCRVLSLANTCRPWFHVQPLAACTAAPRTHSHIAWQRRGDRTCPLNPAHTTHNPKL